MSQESAGNCKLMEITRKTDEDIESRTRWTMTKKISNAKQMGEPKKETAEFERQGETEIRNREGKDIPDPIGGSKGGA